MKSELGDGPNLRRFGPWAAQIMRKSILPPNRNFHEIGCPRPKSAQKPSPSSDHEKINFCGRIAIFMKLGAHGPNRRRIASPSSDHEKINFYSNRNFHEIGCPRPKSAQIWAVPELRSWENQFLRPNRNFHEIGWPRPKSAQKGRHIRAQISWENAIFTAESQFSWNWVPTAQIGADLGRAPAQIMRKSIFTAESQFSWNWVPTAQIGAEGVPELRSWENQFLRPNRNFHEIGCPRPKSAQNPSPSSDHEKINFYGRIAIFMKLGAHGPNRRRTRPRAQIMRKSIFTAESQFSWNWVPTAQIGAEPVPELRSWENQFLRPNRNFHEIGCPRPKSAQNPSLSSDHEKINFYGRIAIFMKLGAHGPNRRRTRLPAQIMRKSIFTAESWIFMKLGAHGPNRRRFGPSASSDHEKINFYGRIAIFMKLGAHGPNRRRTRPWAQIMRKSIFTAESQFSWNWVPTAQIGAEPVSELRSWENQFLRPNRNFHEIGCPRPKSAQNPSRELRSWENQFLRPNRNFHEIGCPRPKSAQKASASSDHEKINFYGRIAIFMKLGAHGPNRRRFGPSPAQIMRKSIFTAESQFSWNWVPTAQIGAEPVSQLRSWENQFLRPNRNFHEIGCPRPKSAQKASASSDHEKINFYGRIAIFMKLGANGPNRRRSRSPAQIMRKSIFTAESQFSWNWVPTAQIGAELRLGRPRAQIMRKSIFTAESQFSWNWVGTAQIGAEPFDHGRRNFHEIGCPANRRRRRRRAQIMRKIQFLRPNRNFHEIGCPRPKSARKPSPSSDHEKINFYGRIAIFMKLGAHGPNGRRRRPRAQIMRKSIFTAESQFSWNWVATAQIGAEDVPELISWENQFLRPNRNFHEIGCPRPKSARKPSPSSDHEKINFYGRIAIFMKLCAHGPNGRRRRPRAQIMRKSIFTAEPQFLWNWVPTAQIGAEGVPELRSWENQFLRPNRNFHEIGCPRPKSAQNPSPS